MKKRERKLSWRSSLRRKKRLTIVFPIPHRWTLIRRDSGLLKTPLLNRLSNPSKRIPHLKRSLHHDMKTTWASKRSRAFLHQTILTTISRQQQLKPSLQLFSNRPLSRNPKYKLQALPRSLLQPRLLQSLIHQVLRRSPSLRVLQLTHWWSVQLALILEITQQRQTNK